MPDTKQELIDKWVAKDYSPKLAAQIVDDTAEIHGNGAAAAPLVKVGQKIQVRQIDSAVFQKDRPPTPGVVHWIYATVLEVLGGSLAMVQISQPGNIEHGTRKVVTPADYRTKAYVQAELDSLPANSTNDGVKDLRRSLGVQLNLLT